MELKLITYPDERLETKIDKEWDFDNPQYDAGELRIAMLQVMKAYEGIGLSANQVGVMDARCFVFFNQQVNNRDSAEVLCLNPTYEVHDDSVDVSMWEGCLSFPGINLEVSRPSTIKAKWFDHTGREFEEKLIGYQARCFMHEIDHLNGITMDQHVAPVKWKEALQKAGKK